MSMVWRRRPEPDTRADGGISTVDRAADDAPAASTSRRRDPSGAGAGSLLLLAAVAVAALAALAVTNPPGPVPASAPAGAFSADRAVAQLAVLATGPHPAGTAAHDAVRDELVSRLRTLGLAPTVHEAMAAKTGNGTTVVGRMQNIQADLPGTAPTGRLLLVAHYDSVDIGPGATDNGIGVSTLLEVARALRSGPAPRNDVTFLFTDGEEEGLLGARAFVASGSGTSRTVVLNLDARGVSGRVLMYQAGAHNAALLPALDHHVPVATSLSDAVYRLLGNDTDFTVLRNSGLTGLNLAIIGSGAYYHGPLDDLTRVNRASLQDMGSAVLGATRALSGANLGETSRAGDATWFSVGGVLLRYPSPLVLPLALLAVVATAAALWLAMRRRVVAGRAVAAVTATVPVVLAGAAAVGLLGWSLIGAVRPDYGGLLLGIPYRMAVTAGGLSVIVVALVLGWLMLMRRRFTAVDVIAGLGAWSALLALVTAVTLPGASYVFAWPAVIGAAGLAAATRLPRPRWRPVLAGLGALAYAALLAPLVPLMFDTLGLALAAAPLILLAACAMPALAPAVARVPRRAVALPMVAVVAVVGIALTAAGITLDRTGRDTPAQLSLVYTVDADGGRPQWVSSGVGGTQGLDAYVGRARQPVEDAFPSLVHAGGWLSGPAPAHALPAPALSVQRVDRAGGDRVVHLHLSASGGMPSRLMLYVDTASASVRGAGIGSLSIPGGRNRPFATTSWQWGLSVVAPPATGVDITLTLGGTGPARLRVVAQSSSLPVAPPTGVTWAATDSGISLVSRGYQI